MDCACARGASRSRHFFPLLRTRDLLPQFVAINKKQKFKRREEKEEEEGRSLYLGRLSGLKRRKTAAARSSK